MDYDYLKLNTRDFEHLVQALTQNLLGNNSLVFGDGPDGARELTHRGKCSFPNIDNPWDGYWIVQAKFKARQFNQEDDFEWVKQNFIAEMKKFENKKRKIEKPKNYIFFTNAKLTAVEKVGGRDKIEQIKKNYSDQIPNIHIVSYDDMNRLLDNNRDVATAFSSFILPGDILTKLFELLNYSLHKSNNIKNTIINYLEKSFSSEQHSKLIQAGDLTNQINLEKVFIDIDVSTSKNQNKRIKFLNHLIRSGDIKSTVDKPIKFVLIGGAGSGKSTLSQFSAQIYASHFILNFRKNEINIKIKNFLQDSKACPKPNCTRFPFKINLKDLAGWMNDQNNVNESQTILNYIKFRIKIISDSEIDIDSLREFLSNISTLFIFDGLDEVPVTSNREQVLREIGDFIDIELKNQSADAIILCTTRQQGYSKEFDENTFEHFYVNELLDKDCLDYLEKLLLNIESSFDNRRSYLTTLREALQDEVTGRLMRTPLQATIMTILVKTGGKPSRNKFNLFKEYYETIYKRELQKALLPILKDNRRNIDSIHSLLGFELQAISEGNENPSALIDMEHFKVLVRNYLKIKEDWKDNKINEFIEILCKVVIERLVFIGEIQTNKIGFVIRSLQEYFAANYLIDHEDSKVIEIIREISTSSYWRNTFLFSVSGMHNLKTYLIDQVYLQCERLNGVEDPLSISSAQNSISYGSLLAIEILSDGIFSDSPKNKNRFVRLLNKVFWTDNSDELEKIQNLPYDIEISDYVIENINNVLLSEKKYNQKVASYNLAFILLKNPNYNLKIISLLEKGWDENHEFDLIYKMFYCDIRDTDFFINIFSVALLKDDYLKYLEIFHYDSNDKLTISEILIKKNNLELTSRVIESLVLVSLDYLSNNDQSIYTLFNELIDTETFAPNSSQINSLIGSNYNNQAFMIGESFSVEVTLLNSENQNLDAFLKLFKKYSISYLTSYILFIKSPTSRNLLNVFIELKKRDNKIIYDKMMQGSKIWILRKICIDFNSFINIDEVINLIATKELESANWLQLEEVKLLNGENFNEIIKCKENSTISDENIIYDFYNMFKNQLTKENIFLKIQFIEFFDIASIKSIDNFKNNENYSEIINLLIESLNSIDLNSSDYWFKYYIKNGIISYIYFSETRDLHKIKSDLFTLFDISEIINYRIIGGSNEMFEVLKRCIQFYNSQNELKNTTKGIEKLIVNIMTQFNDKFLRKMIVEINFTYKNDLDPEKNVYDIFINLITGKIELKYHDEIILKLSENISVNEIYKEIAILYKTLKKFESEDALIFNKIYNDIKNRENIEIATISKVQQYLKLLIETRKTELIKFQLK